ncbi:MAG: glycoside hydrolase family 3 N-terminal domain-containing protein [Gammaproteobacteria bacterium]|jgi:beta-N-acetylhexosaminidase
MQKILEAIIFFAVICFFIILPVSANPSLNQEIGQMIMIGFDGSTLHQNDPVVQDIIKKRIGGVVLFDYNYKTKTFDKNVKNPCQLKRLVKQLQSYSAVPLFVGIDYEGGTAGTRLKPLYGFPKTVSAQYLGSQPLSVTKKYATLMAETLNREGINLVFAPVVDLNINPNNPVIGKLGRSFSKHPNNVIKSAAIFIDTYKKYHILCTLKHFPGHGSSIGDTHKGFVDVTNTWQSQELTPYKKLIDTNQACDLIMAAHIINYSLDSLGHPASISYPIITELLRHKLGFKGIVITDDLQMQAITDKYNLETTVKLAIKAGADILLFGNQLKYQPRIAQKVIQIVNKLIKQGVISKQRIDLSYNRIMALKRKYFISKHHLHYHA